MKFLLSALASWTALLLSLALSPAHAGDIASFQPWGFSKDGRVFAFEEYGRLDGSGFVYSNFYAIDTMSDEFLQGTPIRIKSDTETESLGNVRRRSLSQGGPLITKYNLANHPGELVAFNPVTEAGKSADLLRYRALLSDPPVGQTFTLKIENMALPSPDTCKNLDKSFAGFRLVLTEKNGKAAKDVLHVDNRIPESRNCPLSYRLGGVMTYRPPSGAAVHIALVNVISYGFEGHNGRWLAVPFRP